MFSTNYHSAVRTMFCAFLSGAFAVPGTATGASITEMLTSADFATAIGRTIRFHDAAGTQLGDLTVPYPGGTTESLRDITQLADGRLAVFNGTFNPYLSVLDVNTATWTHTLVPGWSTSNNTRFGGIASVGHLVFMSNAAISGSPSAGTIRHNLLDGTSILFDTTYGTHDVNVGLDGLVYSLGRGGDAAREVNVHHPLSLELQQTVNLSSLGITNWQPNSVVADAAGMIYIGNNSQGHIHVFTPDGTFSRTIATGTDSVRDLDLREDGTLLFSTGTSGIYRSNLEQDQFSQITTSTGYVAFIIPEPGAPLLAGLSAALMAFGRRVRPCRR